VHWTGKDVDAEHPRWYEQDPSERPEAVDHATLAGSVTSWNSAFGWRNKMLSVCQEISTFLKLIASASPS